MTINETTTDWDLTLSISPYLDRHMMFPLLEYLDTLIQAGKIEYSAKDVAAARLSLLRPTHMVDYAIDIYKNLNGTDTAPEEMLQQKEKVYQRLEELRAGCKSLYDLCQNTQERVSPSYEQSLFIHAPVLTNMNYLFLGQIDGQWTVECG
jgi:translation initiation factor 3 subunit E